MAYLVSQLDKLDIEIKAGSAILVIKPRANS
jgi:hypothetical protein